MVNHGNRGRITIRPLDTNYARYHHKTLADRLPKGWQPEGLIDDGLLARNIHTGTLMVWQGFAMKSVDPRKAEAALRDYNDQSR